MRLREVLIVALGLALATATAVVGIANEPSGNHLTGLDFRQDIGMSYAPSKSDQAYSFEVANLCADHHAPVRITSVRPMTTVGRVTLDRAGLSAPVPDTQHMAPSTGGGMMPASWNLRRTVAWCGTSKPKRETYNWLAVQITRHGPESAAIVGLEVNYLDERGVQHSKKVPQLSVGLCGKNKIKAACGIF